MSAASGLPKALADILEGTGFEIEAPETSKIFTNRDLAFEQIAIIGFDMDYTLAVYNQAELEALSIESTITKLIERGYPENLRRMSADPSFAVRGLMVDKKLGNIVKMDRHGYVGQAYHGRRKLPRSERKSLYRAQRLGRERARFAQVDTLFALPEVTVYAEVVERIDHEPKGFRGPPPSYAQAFEDVRASIDEAHRDGSIKDRIKAELDRYFVIDPKLGDTLHNFRSAGKRLFLLTNSFYPYTNAVLSRLLPGGGGRYRSWRDYFDWIIVGSMKPGFFTEGNAFQELTITGDYHGDPVPEPQRGRIYEGGNQLGLQAALGVHADQVLYVGDHIYGDIVRSKKSSGWRTALIVEDLEHDLAVQRSRRYVLEEIESLTHLRIKLTDEITAHRYLASVLARRTAQDLIDAGVHPSRAAAMLEDSRAQIRRRFDWLRKYEAETADTLERRIDEINAAFNPYWGSVFTARHDTSQFGAQVELYACLYTSRVTNFRYVSPVKYFHSPANWLPHWKRVAES
ncbi:MAG: HAD-IG family 5'-nucleotidase [Myxococcales bacterium]|nr:HAD-IG family 5'-nucleotidase [Myxococcales bacterium]MCB9750122.1 HAD-IG family 5'-nucleotidase [Myxococcales bacterium]